MLTVGPASLAESARLRRAAVAVHAFNRAHRRTRVLSLATGFGVSDAVGDLTTFTLRFAVI